MLTLAIWPYIISRVSKWAWTHMHKWFQQQSLGYKPQTTYQCLSNVYNFDFTKRLFMQQFINLDFLSRSYCFVFHATTINTTPWQLAACWGESTLHGGQLWHFHDMYQKYTPPKCVAFNFGFHFLCLGFIFSFSQS